MKTTTALMYKFRRRAANAITICRIFGSILLLLFPLFSRQWYAVYLLCGFTDMIDGAIARITGSASRLGAKLDSIADGIFIAAAAIRLLPVLELPAWIWLWTALIFLIRMIHLVRGFLRRKRFAVPHTLLNKVTGFMLFLLPLALPWIRPEAAFPSAACTIATIAALQEGHILRAEEAI